MSTNEGPQSPRSEVVARLFGEIVVLDPQARLDHLRHSCPDDESLRREVEELLEAHEESELQQDFLAPVLDVAPELAEALHGETLREGLRESQLGPYRLIACLGEGGMGAVWKAEQEEPVRRTVAVKLIKAGMDTDEVIARFNAERRVLAMMDHPNIAKVHDAGQTEKGRPYFVMELVDGLPVTTYCDQRRLPLSERLTLFTQICKGVQHAHQKGIIHRDIKPTNVLVVEHDGLPVPKLIDFGIAKAIDRTAVEKTMLTQDGQFVGTLGSMSPEQAAGKEGQVDTRTDIYSLGVLLYELLTGLSLIDNEEFLSAGQAERMRIIEELEPLKPSTRLNSSSADIESLASRRGMTPATKLARILRGDLDWVVMKALEKEPERRYSTASELAADLARYLLAQPVEAGPPSKTYRIKKYVQRHRGAVVMATVVLSTILIGAGISIRQAVRATVAEKVASARAKKSELVADFLADMLEGVKPSVALGRDTTMLREILDRTAEKIGSELGDFPEVEAELSQVLAKVYFELGEYGSAEELHREELRLRREELTKDPQAIAACLGFLAKALHGQGKLDDAGDLHQEALAIRRDHQDKSPLEVAETIGSLALIRLDQGRLKPAEELYRETLELLKKHLGEDHEEYATALNAYSMILLELGKLDDAEKKCRQGLELTEKHFEVDHPKIAACLNNLSMILTEKDDMEEAEVVLRRAIGIWRKLHGDEHPNLATGLSNLGMVLRDLSRPEEAEEVLIEALKMTKKLLGEHHWHVASTLNNLAILFEDQEKLAEAEQSNREALAIMIKQLGEVHTEVATVLSNLGRVLERQGKLAESKEVLTRALRARERLLNRDHFDLRGSYRELGVVLYKNGNLIEAKKRLQVALELGQKRVPDSWLTHYSMAMLGAVTSQEDPVRAEKFLLDGHKGMARRLQKTSMQLPREMLLEVHRELIEFYKKSGRNAEAKRWEGKLPD